MEMPSKPILYGSLITLRNTENFYLCAQGFIDNSPYLKKEIYNNFSLSVFRIIPASIYSVQTEIIDFTRETKENELFNKQEKLTKLEDSLEGEIKINMHNYNALKGKSINYESLIQLEHVQSHKFLTLENDKTAEVENKNLKVSLEDFSSEYSHFRILPGYEYQKYCDKVVQSSHKIYLEILASGIRKPAFLHSSKSHFFGLFMRGVYSFLDSNPCVDNYLEVNISFDQKTRWVLTEFSESVYDEKYINCGDFI